MPVRDRHLEEVVPELSNLKVKQRVRAKYGGYWYHAEILEIDRKREIPVKVKYLKPYDREEPRLIKLDQLRIKVLVKAEKHEDDSSSTEEDEDMRRSKVIGFIRSMRKNARSESNISERLRIGIKKRIPEIKIKRLVKLVKRKGRLDAPLCDRTRNTALHVASESGNLEAMQILIDAGSFVGSKNKAGMTSLHLSVAHGFEKGVSMLISRGGADVSVRNTRGQTPLLTAVLSGRVEQVMSLLRRGGSKINTTDKTGRTALHWSIIGGHSKIIQTVLKQKGVDVLCKDKNGYTPLHFAASRGSISSMTMLLRSIESDGVRNLALKSKTQKGASVLHLACESGNLSLVKTLVSGPAWMQAISVGLNDPDREGLTPLHYALRSGEKQVVQYLMKSGADTSLRTILMAKRIASSSFSSKSSSSFSTSPSSRK